MARYKAIRSRTVTEEVEFDLEVPEHMSKTTSDSLLYLRCYALWSAGLEWKEFSTRDNTIQTIDKVAESAVAVFPAISAQPGVLQTSHVGRFWRKRRT